MSVPRKVAQFALVDLHQDKMTTNDKWLTLGAIHFKDGIDFTICKLKKAVNKLGPVVSKIFQGKHTSY
jgi:hypothetical protein